MSFEPGNISHPFIVLLLSSSLSMLLSSQWHWQILSSSVICCDFSFCFCSGWFVMFATACKILLFFLDSDFKVCVLFYLKIICQVPSSPASISTGEDWVSSSVWHLQFTAWFAGGELPFPIVICITGKCPDWAVRHLCGINSC